MKTSIFFTSVLILLSFALHAQEKQPFEIDYTITSEAFGDEREITVYLPPSYYRSPDDQYTVTYILDGHYDPFVDLGVKTIEYNANSGRFIPTIIVGIHAKARGWEFSAPTPGDEDNEDYKGGRAPELQLHFENEVFPLIDSLYPRTLPFRTLIGHSSGGTFVLYTLFSEQKNLFDAYIAISPGIRSDSEYVLDNAVSVLQAGEKLPKFLYCSSGTVGEREFLFGNAVNRLDSILNSHPEHQLIWRKSTFEGMGHWTCVSPSFNTAMVELTNAFRVGEQQLFDFSASGSPPMLTQLEDFYENINSTYGFSDIPRPRFIDQVARWMEDNNQHQAAAETYDWALIQYPGHYPLTKAKAKLLLRTDQKEAAITTLKTCLSLLETEKDKHDEEWYQNQKEYLGEKIAEASK